MLIPKVRFFFSFLFLMQFISPAQAYAQSGSMRYNDISKSMEFHDGNAWHNFLLGLPVGPCSHEGEMDFDPLLSVLGTYRFCNGTDWIQVLGVTTLDFCSQKAAIEVTGNKLQVCNGIFWVNIKGLPA